MRSTSERGTTRATVIIATCGTFTASNGRPIAHHSAVIQGSTNSVSTMATAQNA